MWRTRFISVVVAGLASLAVPASASADAAETALGALIVHADGHGVPDGVGGMNVVVACSAIGVAPATSTYLSCSAGPARASVTTPGSAAATAGTGSGAYGPFTVCVTATAYPLTGPPVSSSACRPSIGPVGSVVLGLNE